MFVLCVRTAVVSVLMQEWFFFAKLDLYKSTENCCNQTRPRMEESSYDSTDENWPPDRKDPTGALDLLLTTTNTVFRDLRIGELNKRINELELRLFFKDYGTVKLTEAMNGANFGLEWGDSPRCSCKACFYSARGNNEEGPDFDEDKASCDFTVWFERMALMCGLTFYNAYKVMFF